MDSIAMPRLQEGNTVCILAPSGSMGVVKKEVIKNIVQCLKGLGLKTIFGDHVNENRYGAGGTPEQRAQDIMNTFTNPAIQGIIPIFGGYHVNQVLPLLDYEIIQQNPKFFMGYSDITALNIALYCRTGLVTYHGPGASQLGHYWPSDYTVKHFEKIAFHLQHEIIIHASECRTEGDWWKKELNGPDPREWIENKGMKVIQEGVSSGIAFGGNISTLALLLGQNDILVPDDAIIFLEQSGGYGTGDTIRQLESLIQGGLFRTIRGLVFGRFEQGTEMNEEFLITVLKRYIGDDIPLILNADFGHTEPMFTFPIGGRCKLDTFSQEITFYMQ